MWSILIPLFYANDSSYNKSLVFGNRFWLIAKASGKLIEPHAYLTDILKKLPTMLSHDAVELTPDRRKDQVY